jgi:putative tryptophan/tyrosine transport system substrate-binding protein
VAKKRLHHNVLAIALANKLINSSNVPSAEATMRDLPEAARAIGLQIQILNASTSGEIEAAFATLVRDRADALFVAADTFLIVKTRMFYARKRMENLLKAAGLDAH